MFDGFQCEAIQNDIVICKEHFNDIRTQDRTFEYPIDKVSYFSAMFKRGQV